MLIKLFKSKLRVLIEKIEVKIILHCMSIDHSIFMYMNVKHGVCCLKLIKNWGEHCAEGRTNCELGNPNKSNKVY